MDIAELEVKVTSEKSIAEQKRLQQELDKTGQKGDKTNKKLKQGAGGVSGAIATLRANIGLLGAAFAALGVARFIQDFVKAEQQLLRLRGAINSMGVASEGYEQRLVAQANALQNVTRFGDDQIISIQRQLIQMGAQEQHMGALTKLILDYAEATGKGAEEVGLLVGRALQGQTTMFKRMGIQVDNTISKSEQLQDIFRQMQQRSAGAAELVGASDIGAVAQATNAFGDLREAIGSLFLTLGGDLMRTATKMIKGLESGIKAVVDAINSVKADSPFMKFLLTSPLTHVANASKAIGTLTAGGTLGEAFDQLKGKNPFKAQEDAALAKTLGGSSLAGITPVADPDEVDAAIRNADALRNALQQLSTTADFETAELANQLKFDQMKESLKDIRNVLDENSDALLNMDDLFKRAMDRQKQLLERTRDLSRLQRGMIEAPRGGLGAEISAARSEAGGARDLESFEHAQSKMAILQAERARRLEFDVAKAPEAFSSGWEMAVESYGTSAQKMATISNELANSMDQNITDGLMNMVDGTMSVEEAFASMANAIIQDLIRVMIQQLIVRNILQGLGMGGGGGGGFMRHDGGVVGEFGKHRDIGQSSWTGSGRYASGGVAGDEVPIIAHRGEVILNEDQFGQMLGGMKPERQKVEVINVMDPAMVDERLAANPNAVLNIISRNRQTIRASLGFR